jgi:hypothetical protein
MGRVLFLVVLIYCYGDPGFDGHRPASLDRPLRDFHRAIDSAGRDAQRALVAIDDAVPKIHQLGDKLRRVGEALAPS